MIFVTTGTQLPFPRLIAAIDTLASTLDEEIVAQVGPDTTARPHLDVRATLTPAEFAALFERARVVVAHAGIGTVLSAKKIGKPLIVVPRRFALGEHRNDHQMATAKQIEPLTGIYVAWETEALPALLQENALVPATPEPGPAADRLLTRLRDFIDG